MGPVVLLYVSRTGQSGVGGLIERFDVIFALNFNHALGYDVF